MTAKDSNKNAAHPLQACECGEFRKKTGIKVIREDNFLLTIHKVPCLPADKAHLPWNIGYLPKGNFPNKKMIEKLKKIGKENSCIFIQLEPNVSSSILNRKSSIINFGLVPATHPLFTKYTFVLDLTKS